MLRYPHRQAMNPSPVDPSALEASRRRTGLLLLPLAAMATATAWLMSYANHSLNPVDRWLLPLLTLEALLLWGLLYLRRLSVREVEMGTVVGLGAYQLAMQVYLVISGEVYRDGFGATSLWYPLMFPLIFLILPREQALRFSVTYYLLGLTIGLVGLALGASPSLKALNSFVQFYVVCVVYLVLLDIYARVREQYFLMRQMAHTDPLTGLANRRAGRECLEHTLNRAAPGSAAVILADLDHFKAVNDRYGHSVGDQVLREVAFRLDQELREGDLLARWGGEEFLILVQGADLEQAQRLAQRLGAAVQEQPVAGGIGISLSFGVAVFRPGDSVETLLERADQALYRAKHLGRRRVELEA
ncbi:putative diguanylate cyclase YdaM [Calidithermus roseus]|uniref:Putative diguanylate cyclase YdaM n=2 Tax=Calidithermus roseus TaxID=1644118 RepID=A0A399EMV0_9DEIN|nr:putative diguanylate cyclase YdaM [Calidithermus roseus]